jgi:sugar phosphate isomerase/epimerase
MQEGLSSFDGSSGPRVCVENMPARRILGLRLNVHWWNTVKEWQRLPNLALDTTHLGTWGLDIMNVYRGSRARVRHVHLSNFNGREHRRLEDGHLPLADLLDALRVDGYKGHIVVELAPEALEAHDERKVLAHLKNQAAFCRKRLNG